MIYGQFEKVIRNKYLASEDYLQLLAEKIPESKLLKNIQVFIDGFHSFTPQEYAVIEALLKHAGQVTVALTVDYPYRSFMPDDYHLFRMPGETYAMLFEIAEINGIPVEGDLVLHEQHRFNHPSLRHLEQTFEKLPAEPFEGDPNIYICEASNLRAEIEGVGRKIISLVRDKDLRYKDIAILVRNSTGYHELFETIFADYQIPYYIDQKRSMLNHPLIELVRSTLEVITGYWRYDPIFRAVKTDLLFPLNGNIHVLREKMDRLENYCLAFGIQGKKWTSKERWPYRRLRGLDFDYPQTDEERAIEQEINESRLLISAPILRLARRMNNAKTGKERCTALFLYLEELDIPAKLEKMQIAAEEKGNLILAREHEQAWTEMLNLLDQYVEILGNEEVTLKQFAEIIEAGLESLRFSLVPPAVDQVIIADLEMSRLSDVKVAFVIGLNDDVLPMKFQDDGVLSDEEREQLITSGIKLAPTNLKKILDEDFVAYKAFTTPSDALFISYPLANEEGKALMPSPYIKRLKEMFPNAHELEFHHEANHLEPEEQLEFLMNWNEALTHVTYQLQQYKRGYKIADLWWDSYNLLIEHKRKIHVMFFKVFL